MKLYMHYVWWLATGLTPVGILISNACDELVDLVNLVTYTTENGCEMNAQKLVQLILACLSSLIETTHQKTKQNKKNTTNKQTNKQTNKKHH